MDLIQTNINQKLKEQNLSVAELERCSGLKTNAVRNILIGQSKNPGAKTLTAIAKALGCSVDALLTENALTSNKQKYIDMKLYLSCVKVVYDYIKVKNIEISMAKLHQFLDAIYNFSQENNKKIASKDFTKWFIENNL